MKSLIIVSDKVGGFDVSINLKNLSAIQWNSLYQSFHQYLKYIEENPERFGLPEMAKELPDLLIKELEVELKRNESDSVT